MGEVVFRSPELFLTLPAALAAALLWRLVRRRRYVAWTTVRWLDGDAYAASAVRRLPAVCVAAALAAVAAALADPVLPYSESRVEARGLDIVLVVDLSQSMKDTMAPFDGGYGVADPAGSGKTRLTATKEALEAFIRKRRDDRVGLVVFSSNAYLVSPLTFDHEYLLQYVEMLDEDVVRGEGMTAIGEGVAVADALLTKQSARGGSSGEVIVVFTDGENNIGRDPVEAIGAAASRGVTVHMIGVALAVQMQKPAIRRVVAAVRRHGGRFYNADTERELHGSSAEIDRLEKGFLASDVTVRNAPVFHWFAAAALVVATFGGALRAVPYFVDLT